jgi:hypothetical protein
MAFSLRAALMKRKITLEDRESGEYRLKRVGAPVLACLNHDHLGPVHRGDGILVFFT